MHGMRNIEGGRIPTVSEMQNMIICNMFFKKRCRLVMSAAKSTTVYYGKEKL